MPSADSIANTRVAVFGLTGGVCLLYIVMALATGRPDPMPFWIPGVCGVLAGLVLTVTSRAAGRRSAEMAWDEGYASDARGAAAIAFWIALLLYPAFGVLISLGLIAWDMAFAIMGLLTGGSYLLLLAWFDLRGRA